MEATKYGKKFLIVNICKKYIKFKKAIDFLYIRDKKRILLMAIHEVKSASSAKKTEKTRKVVNTNVKNFKKQIIIKGSTAPKSDTAKFSTNGWSGTLYEMMSTWGIREYKWSPISSTNDAIEKSQNHLIDLLRYYEGDPDNVYKANMKYNDENGITTYGYGVVNLNSEIRKKYNVTLPPKSEYAAYQAMMIYLKEVAIDDIHRNIGKTVYDNAPQTVKEALLDLAFNKGDDAFKAAKGLKNAIRNEDWVSVLKSLVYTKPNSNLIKNITDDAGLHRRSLSRVILAAKGLPKSQAVEETIKQIYNDAIRCAKAQNKSLDEFEKIYRLYKTGSCEPVAAQSNEAINSDGTKTYRINQEQMGLFSIARSMRPDGANIADRTGFLRAIMEKIVEINGLKSDGKDDSGYPKTALLKNGDTLKLPVKLEYEGKSINLNPPAEMENITGSVDAQKVDSITASKEKTNIEAKTENEAVENRKTEESSLTDYILSGLSGAGLGVLAGIAKKARKTKLGMFAAIGFTAGIGLKKLFLNLFKKKGVDEGFNPNDPAVTPFQRLYHSDNIKITEDRHTVKLENGEEQEIVLQTVEQEYEVQPYSPDNNETVWNIAKRYGMSRKELGEYNELKLSNDSNGVEGYHTINAGQKLTIKRIGYKVEKEDTFYSIAKKFGITPEILMDANNMTEEDSTKLEIGTMLELPAYMHKVKKGETLSEIAQKAGVDTEVLRRVNNLPTYDIIAGDELKVVYTKDPDQKISSSKTVDGKTVQEAMVDITPDLSKRPHLQKKTIVNGKVVATRDEWTSNVKNGELSGRTIVLDAGHGYGQAKYPDVGAPGNGKIEDEWLLNYDNVMILRDKLLAKGAKVIYLQGKRNLVEEAMKEKRNKCDFFISVHANSAGASAKDRTQIYYRVNGVSGKPKENSIKFAEIAAVRFNKSIPLQETISPEDLYSKDKKPIYAEALKGQDGKTKKGKIIPEERTNLLKNVINSTKVPSVIWEVGFMSNKKGRERLKSERVMNNYADIMCSSLIQYFNEQKQYKIYRNQN